jgi:hypothetical protein
MSILASAVVEGIAIAVISGVILAVLGFIGKGILTRRAQKEKVASDRDAARKKRADTATAVASARKVRRDAEEKEKEEVRARRPRFDELQSQVRQRIAARDVRAWEPMLLYHKELDAYVGDDLGKSVTFFAEIGNMHLEGDTKAKFDPMRLSRAFGLRQFHAPDIRAARRLGALSDRFFTEHHDEGTTYLAKRQLVLDQLKFVGEVAVDLNDLMN